MTVANQKSPKERTMANSGATGAYGQLYQSRLRQRAVTAFQEIAPNTRLTTKSFTNMAKTQRAVLESKARSKLER